MGLKSGITNILEYTDYSYIPDRKKYGTTIYDISSLLYSHEVICKSELVKYILNYIAQHNRDGVNIIIFDDPHTRDMNPRKGELCSDRDRIALKYTTTDESHFADDNMCHLISLYRKTPGGRSYVQQCLSDDFYKIMHTYSTDYDDMASRIILYINGKWVIGKDCVEQYSDIDDVIFKGDRKAEADNIIPLVVMYWADRIAASNPHNHLDITSVDSDILLTMYPVLCRSDTQALVHDGRIKWMRPGKKHEQRNRVVDLCKTTHYKDLVVSVQNITSYIVALMGGSDINKQYIASISLLSDLCRHRHSDYEHLFMYVRSGDNITITCNINMLFKYFRLHHTGSDNRKIVNTKNVKNAKNTYEYVYKDVKYDMYPTFGYMLDVIIAFMYYCVNVNYVKTVRSLTLSGTDINLYNKNYYTNPIESIEIKLSL